MDSLEELKEREKKLVEKIKKKRLQLAEADSAMQSRFPSGRFELENEIELFEIRLKGLREELAKFGSN